MDFSNFLGKLDESNSGKKGFVRVSGRQLREAAGESAESLKSGDKWYYVPTKMYGGFRHIVVENGPNNWVVYYLEGVGGVKGDEFGGAGSNLGDDDRFGLATTQGALRAGVDANEARDLGRLSKFLLKEGNGEDNGVDLSGFSVQRSVAGDFATVLKECVAIVKQGAK